MLAQDVLTELKRHANKKRAKINALFFKTGKGQYGYGDVFWGITMPEQRKIAKKFAPLVSIKEVEKFLAHKVHEVRMAGLLILVYKYAAAEAEEKKKIFFTYIKNAARINNWDLVDVTAPHIPGDFLRQNQYSVAILYEFARSQNLWKKRIAIISTFAFIRYNDFTHTLKIAKLLLKDKHDLIHKAVGWMLREVGKKDRRAEEKFLRLHAKHMPRTMLRYAIEKFPPNLRKKLVQRS